MQLPPPKNKIYVHVLSHFQWKFRKILFTQSLLPPEMETRNKLVAQPTKCGSFQNNCSFSQFLGLVLVCSINIYTTRKGILNRDSEAQRPSLTYTKLSGALSYITCPEGTLCKKHQAQVQCLSYVIWWTVTQLVTINLPWKFFSPEETFRIFYLRKIIFCKQVCWKDLT